MIVSTAYVAKFSNNFIEVNDWVAMTLLTIQVKNKLRLVISGSVNENVILAICVLLIMAVSKQISKSPSIWAVNKICDCDTGI